MFLASSACALPSFSSDQPSTFTDGVTANHAGVVGSQHPSRPRVVQLPASTLTERPALSAPLLVVELVAGRPTCR